MIEPERIERTLAATSTLALDVPDGLARAVFYSILLWRVQPFERGNEPLAQLLMNAELASVGEARILVPARLRGRLQLARERLAREGDPGRYVRLLVALQHWSAGFFRPAPVAGAARCDARLRGAGPRPQRTALTRAAAIRSSAARWASSISCPSASKAWLARGTTSCCGITIMPR
jgi:hypothetical protein